MAARPRTLTGRARPMTDNCGIANRLLNSGLDHRRRGNDALEWRALAGLLLGFRRWPLGVERQLEGELDLRFADMPNPGWDETRQQAAAQHKVKKVGVTKKGAILISGAKNPYQLPSSPRQTDASRPKAKQSLNHR